MWVSGKRWQELNNALKELRQRVSNLEVRASDIRLRVGTLEDAQYVALPDEGGADGLLISGFMPSSIADTHIGFSVPGKAAHTDFGRAKLSDVVLKIADVLRIRRQREQPAALIQAEPVCKGRRRRQGRR
jgi:hypothetical protein